MKIEEAQRKWCRKTSVFLSRENGMSGNFVPSRDVPDGPVVRTPGLHSRGHRLDPWVRELRSRMCVLQPKINE